MTPMNVFDLILSPMDREPCDWPLARLVILVRSRPCLRLREPACERKFVNSGILAMLVPCLKFFCPTRALRHATSAPRFDIAKFKGTSRNLTPARMPGVSLHHAPRQFQVATPAPQLLYTTHATRVHALAIRDGGGLDLLAHGIAQRATQRP